MTMTIGGMRTEAREVLAFNTPSFFSVRVSLPDQSWWK